MIELTGPRIFAVPYRNRRPLKPRPIPDGAIVEDVPAELRGHAPNAFQAWMEYPGTEDDENAPFFGFVDVYLLSTGDVAAIYGAKPQPIY